MHTSQSANLWCPLGPNCFCPGPEPSAGGPSFNKEWRNELSGWILCCCRSSMPSGRPCKVSGLFSANKTKQKQQTFFFRSFSFQKLEMAREESAQDKLWLLLPVSTKSFRESPAGPPHCHILFVIHLSWDLIVLRIVFFSLPVVKGEGPVPFRGVQTCTESQTSPQRPQRFVGLSRLLCSVPGQRAPLQDPKHLPLYRFIDYLLLTT